MNTQEIDRSNKDIEDIISLGADIAGGVISTSVGFLFAGPAGALLSAAYGPILSDAIKDACLDIKDRFLAPREKIRVGAATAYAIMEIKHNIDNGITIREDDFFTKDISNRSKADEILEGVLIKSKNDHEEKKIRYYGNLFANIAFAPHIDAGMANALLNIAERLTYQQIILIGIFGRQGKFTVRDTPYAGAKTIPASILSLINEMFMLARENIIKIKAPDGKRQIVLDLGQVNPASIELDLIGINLYSLMDLDTIPLEDTLRIVELLK